MSASMARKAKVRYAVVGAGNIAQVAVLPAFRHTRHSELKAIVSSDAKKLRALGRKYRISHLYDYDELEALAATGEIDALYLALPNHLHREWTERAAALGLHVLCEKPMALSVADCEAMIDATNAAGVLLMIAYRLHFEPANLRAIDLVRKGKIGEPRLFTSLFSHMVRKGDIRMRGETGGGVLFDMGVYCINAARHLFGGEPIEVMAQLVDSHMSDGNRIDDSVAASLRFPGGGVAQFGVSQVSANASSARLCGTRGMIHLAPAFEYVDPIKLELTIDDKTRTIRTVKRDQFAPEIDHFSTCIRTGREPSPSGREGLADVRIVCALLASIEADGIIQLEPQPEASRPSLDLQGRHPAVRKPETLHAPSPSL
jgi:predicted dehydrogenase